jgi:hypothetical protein
MTNDTSPEAGTSLQQNKKKRKLILYDFILYGQGSAEN